MTSEQPGLLARMGLRDASIARFAVVGVINTAIDFAVFSLLYFVAGWHLIASNSAAYALAVANSYLLNRLWTFRHSAGARPAAVQASMFLAFNLTGLLIANLTIAALAVYIAALYAKAASVLVTFVWNYWTSRRFVYG